MDTRRYGIVAVDSDPFSYRLVVFITGDGLVDPPDVWIWELIKLCGIGDLKNPINWCFVYRKRKKHRRFFRQASLTVKR